MPSDTMVISLDIIVWILKDPYWSKRARKVKTLKEMRQLILGFCKAHARVSKTDEETLCI